MTGTGGVRRRPMVKPTLIALAMLLTASCGASSPAPTPSPLPSNDQNLPTRPFAPRTNPISAVSPSSATAGSADTSVTITGGVFENRPEYSSVAVWRTQQGNQVFLRTRFVSATELTAVIPATLLQRPTTASIYVVTRTPNDDSWNAPRSVVTFTVLP